MLRQIMDKQADTIEKCEMWLRLLNDEDLGEMNSKFQIENLLIQWYDRYGS